MMVAIAASNAPQREHDGDTDEDVDPLLASMLQETRARLQANPDDRGLRGRLAMTLDANGLGSEAREQYLALTRLDPGEARWWFHLARMEAEAGDMDAALAAIDTAIAATPDRAELRWRRGLWLIDAGRVDAAVASCREALSLDPNSEPARVALAKALLQGDKVEDAVEILRSVLTTNPDHGYARQLLSAGLRAQGHLDEAGTEAARSAGARPRWPDSWEADVGRHVAGHRATMQQAQSLLQAGRPRDAVPLLERAMAQRPDDVSVLLTLSAAYAGCNRFDLAKKVLSEAPPGVADHFAVHLNLSKVHLQAGDLVAARAEADRAVQRSPLEPAGYVQLAQVLMMQGESAAAWQSWERARSLRPGDAAIESLRPMLEQMEDTGRQPSPRP
jgi:predicted Zn-dependent protease